jgi:hypothetical protein
MDNQQKESLIRMFLSPVFTTEMSLQYLKKYITEEDLTASLVSKLYGVSEPEYT